MFLFAFRKRNNMNRLQFINFIGAIGFAHLLSLKEMDLNEKDIFSYQTEISQEEETFFPTQLNVVSESDALGNIRYYFVEHGYDTIELDPLQINDWDYQSITNSDVFFSNTLPNIEEPGYFWLPDSEKTITVLNAENFLLANHCDTTKSYTKEELEIIEETCSSFAYNPFLWLKDTTFYINNLLLIKIDDTISVFDIDLGVQIEETYKENDKEERRNVVYFYNLLNPKQGIKCNYGLSLEEEQEMRDNYDFSYLDSIYIEKGTSLYQGLSNHVNNYISVLDINVFLNSAQKERGYLYYYELEELINGLLLQDKEQQIYMLTKIPSINQMG